MRGDPRVRDDRRPGQVEELGTFRAALKEGEGSLVEGARRIRGIEQNVCVDRVAQSDSRAARTASLSSRSMRAPIARAVHRKGEVSSSGAFSRVSAAAAG